MLSSHKVVTKREIHIVQNVYKSLEKSIKIRKIYFEIYMSFCYVTEDGAKPCKIVRTIDFTGLAALLY